MKTTVLIALLMMKIWLLKLPLMDVHQGRMQLFKVSQIFKKGYANVDNEEKFRL